MSVIWVVGAWVTGRSKILPKGLGCENSVWVVTAALVSDDS